IPSLRRWQTPVLRSLVSDLRSNSHLTPDQAREAAAAYAGYYQDVCSLRLEAACQALTRLSKDGQAAGFSSLFYMFARSSVTNAMYWSAYDPDDHSAYAQTFWEAVPGLANVTKVIGATPYKTVAGQRYIFLFVVTHELG